MFDVLADGLSVLQGDLGGIAAFLAAVWGMGLLTTDVIFSKRPGAGPRGVAALCVGPVTLAVAAYALVILETRVSGALKFGGFGLLAAAGLRIGVEARRMIARRIAVSRLAAAAVAGGVLVLVLRLAFVEPLLLPPYTDAVVHYQVTRGFLHPELASQANLSLQNLSEQYYHFGFHSLAAWLSSVAGLPPEAAMPLIGQLLLVLAPVSMGFLTRVATGNTAAGIWAGVLAAVGWQMPAFSANWGKYPAISALAVLPAVVACAYLALRERRIGAAVAGVVLLLFGLALLHTRAVIVVGLAAASAWLAGRATPREGFSTQRALRFSVLYVISLAPLYYFLGEFYSAVIPAVMVLGTLPFAFRSFPAVAIGCFLFSYGLWVLTLLPGITGGLVPTVLNEQFVEMMLYMPLALLGGAGFGGLLMRVPEVRGRGVVAAVAGVGAVALAMLASLSAYPDPCCNFVNPGDREALDWIRTETPADSLVLVAGFMEGGQFFGTDAGIWVQPLTNRDSNRMPFDTDWAVTTEIERLCRNGARLVYVYVGGRPYSFGEAGLAGQPWAAAAFTAGQTTIYEVKRCEAVVWQPRGDPGAGPLLVNGRRHMVRVGDALPN